MDDYYANTLAAYGEYPPMSGRYYGVPFLADVMILALRKDLMSAIGKDDIVDLTDLLQTAQLFQSQGNITGIVSGFETTWCSDPVVCYDDVANVFNQLAWSFGGQIWDPSTYKFYGILNSLENIQALAYAKQLAATGPRSNLFNHTAFTDITNGLCNGATAMMAIWGGAMSPVLDPTTCPQAKNISFTIFPGNVSHELNLGGMGMHGSVYSKYPDVVLDFMSWVSTRPIQRKWAQLGQFPTRKSVLGSGTFLNASPFNPAFAISFTLAKDFWNLPEYAELLELHMIYIGKALSGELSPGDALNQLASLQQQVVNRDYPDGPPKPFIPLLTISSAAGVTMFVIISIALLYCVALVYGIGHYRHSRIIVASSPVFCFISLAGTITMLFSALLPVIFQGSSVSNTIAPCMVDVWFFGLSFILMFAPIFAKTYRLYRIFKIDFTVQKVRISNLQLFIVLGALLVLELIILITWTTYDPLIPSPLSLNGGTTQVDRCRCNHQVEFWFVYIAYKIILVLFGVFVTFQTRAIWKTYRESRQLAWCLYNVILLTAVVAPLLFYLTDPTAWFLVKSIGILVMCIFFVTVLFIPKLMEAYENRDDSGSSTSSSKAPHLGSKHHTHSSVVSGTNQGSADHL